MQFCGLEQSDMYNSTVSSLFQSNYFRLVYKEGDTQPYFVLFLQEEDASACYGWDWGKKTHTKESPPTKQKPTQTNPTGHLF